MEWPVILCLDMQAYSLGVAQRAAYSVASDYMVEVQLQGQNLTLRITPSAALISTTPPSPETAKARLMQTLNDFALRERIQQETAGIRDALIRAALAGCSC